MKHIGKKEVLFVAHRMKVELIYNMARSEGNSLSYAETDSVVNGLSVGNKKMFELNQIQRIAKGWDEIIHQVKNNTFAVCKENFILINSIVAEDENIELGDFRTKNVTIGGTKWLPPMPMHLSENFRAMMESFKKTENIESKAFNIFLDAAKNQFFCDGNKRTSQLIMNGFLMNNGYSLFSISPENDVEYKEKLVQFYETGNKEEMLHFMGKQVAQLDSKFNLVELNNKEHGVFEDFKRNISETFEPCKTKGYTSV